MIGREWTVGHHRFFNASEYQAALRDQKLINTLENTYDLHDIHDLDKLYSEIARGHIRFESVIGREFDDMVYERRIFLHKNTDAQKESGKSRKLHQSGTYSKKSTKSAKIISLNEKKSEKKQEKKKEKKITKLEELDSQMQKEVLKVLKRKQRSRKMILLACIFVGIGCGVYLIQYMNNAKNSSSQYQDLADLKDDRETIGEFLSGVQVHKTKEKDVEIPNVLTEYKKLQAKNEDLIGWIKIADTNIDYPVMQGEDNEYYLQHNFDKAEDKNGCIFMDTQCDVIRHSMNYILYGHHMQSGNMFGNLYKYEDEEYGKAHKTIQFDTIYEKGTYELMYVFRSKVLSEEDISFKYYQFIDAYSSKEFNSNMNEMAKLSYYDTGVTATYGDQLLTLSTCDYEETGGRFVLVCKRIN